MSVETGITCYDLGSFFIIIQAFNKKLPGAAVVSIQNPLCVTIPLPWEHLHYQGNTDCGSTKKEVYTTMINFSI